MDWPLQREVSLVCGAWQLRPLQPADADAVYHAVDVSRREIGRWLVWCHPHYQRTDAVAFLAGQAHEWASGRGFCFGLWERATHRLLGSIALNNINHANLSANLGYWVRTDATRRGAASQATRCLALWGLTELGLQRIEIVAAVPNVASQRVAEKAGAVREGVLRKRLRVHGQALDAVMFSLTSEDFK